MILLSLFSDLVKIKRVDTATYFVLVVLVDLDT